MNFNITKKCECDGSNARANLNGLCDLCEEQKSLCEHMYERVETQYWELNYNLKKERTRGSEGVKGKKETNEVRTRKNSVITEQYTVGYSL